MKGIWKYLVYEDSTSEVQIRNENNPINSRYVSCRLKTLKTGRMQRYHNSHVEIHPGQLTRKKRKYNLKI